METKKVILGDFNCTMDKMDTDGENKTQRLYRCSSNYALSKLIVDNGLEDIWRREKLKLEKIHGTLIIRFYVSQVFLSYKDLSYFLLKTQNKRSSASDWWEYTKSSFKENAKISSKNSTTQKNITLMTGGKTPNLVLKRRLALFPKIPPLQKVLKF